MTRSLAESLGLALFESADGGLRLASEPPAWFRDLLPAEGELELLELCPFLEVFVPDAEEYWAAPGPKPLYSDVWTQHGGSGKEYHLRALALSADGRDYLAIECPESLYGETRAFVQHAHDTTLQYDKIAKLSRALAEANSELERATRAKSEFLARMSHEIRTPLNAILGMAELLWESEMSPEQREYVRIFRRAGDNLLNLINDILDLSKVEAGHLELERIEFDLVEVLEKAAEIVAVKAHAKGLELSCRIAPDAPTRLIGDPGRLRQVIINLMGNAVKFTEAGGVACFVERDSESADPGALRFGVSDTGIGIAADKVDKVFESFSQADSSTTRKYGGTGLGLSISKKFVELMGGRIWVESELGKGSKFLFTPKFGVAEAAPPPPEFAGLRCLVADDNDAHRAAVRDLLLAWGAQVAEAPGGEAALRHVRANPEAWDVALLDARMPDVDGFAVAAEIHRMPAFRGRALLMLTTERPADAARCREAGVRAVLKPLRRSELLECMRLPEGQAPQIARAAADLGGFRILLADDSEDNRFLVRNYLRNSGCALVEAVDGGEVVEKFRQGPWSVVLVDVQMPVMDGYAATGKMREQEAATGAAHTPILALTAHALAGEAQKSKAAGCDAHLTKPIQKPVLLEAIARHGRPVAVTAAAAPAPAQPAPAQVAFVAEAATPAEGVQGRFHMQIDSSLEDIVPGYLQHRRNEIPKLRDALAQADYTALRVLGHNMKGSGTAYGFPPLTAIGAAVEEAALRGDAAQIAGRLDELTEFLRDVTFEFVE